jgi:hypothetical protein
MCNWAFLVLVCFVVCGCAGRLVSNAHPKGGTGVTATAKRYNADSAHGCPSGMSRGGDGFCRPPNRNRD